MSVETTEAAVQRRKRVQRLKKYIIRTMFFLILLPTVFCVALFLNMRRMDKSLAELTDRLKILTAETVRQQDMINELIASMRVTIEGSQAENEASREFTKYEVKVPEPTVDSTEEIAEENPDRTAGPAHKVYLTFDDGPSANTVKILDILDSYDVKATFFVVGKESDAALDALTQIVERGHSLGMHSYSHKYAEIYSSEESFAEDFEKIRSYIYDTTGVTSSLYRFPGGSSNTVSKLDMHVFIDYLDNEDVSYFDWNISSGDAGKTRLSVEQLVKNATKDIKRQETSIILMHDAAGKTTTLEALPIIIENILAMEDTVILPITEDTRPVQHIQKENNN